MSRGWNDRGTCSDKEICLIRWKAQPQPFPLLQPVLILATVFRALLWTLLSHWCVPFSHFYVCVSGSHHQICKQREGRDYIPVWTCHSIQFNPIQYNIYLLSASFVPVLGFGDSTKQTKIRALPSLDSSRGYRQAHIQ